MQLTKDTDKMFCLIYQEFLNRRKAGSSKSEAKQFGDPTELQNEFLQGTLEDDIYDSVSELSKNDLIKSYVDGSFYVTDSGIIYMENRFTNGIKEVADFISKFIP